MDDDRGVEPEPERVTRPREHDRVGLVAALIVAALLIGVVRPWDLLPGSPAGPAGNPTHGQPGGTLSAAAASESPGSPSPSPNQDPYAALWGTCGSPSGWRAATVQQWAGRPGPIRSWIAIDPIEASGPLDPAIPFAPVATDVVTAIGYCSPLADDLRPPESARAMLWSLAGSTALPVGGVPIEPARPSALGGLWQPPPTIATRIDGFEAWPPGRYVLEIRSPSGPFDRWLGIEIEDLRARPTPSPGGGPVATGSPGVDSGTQGASQLP